MSIIDRLSSKFRDAPDPDPASQGRTRWARMSTPPVWKLLTSRSGSHLYFLNPDHVQLGLLDMIERPPRHVLDVGCYCGATGETIKRRWPGAKVIGIEPLAEAAALAAPRIDRVITGTLESVDFEQAGLAPESIDTIILADVLEHIFNPWLALQRLRTLLTDDGVVLASIPNVRNLGLIHNLRAATGRTPAAACSTSRTSGSSRWRRSARCSRRPVSRSTRSSTTSIRPLHSSGASIRSREHHRPVRRPHAQGRDAGRPAELATIQFYVRAGRSG